MGQESLITAIDEDARAQAVRIVQEAREAAEASLKEAAAEADAEEQERVGALGRRLLGKKAGLLNDARTRASGERLAVRRELADRAIEEARKRLCALPDDEYALFLGQMFSELETLWKRERPGEDPVALVNPADVRHLKTSVKVKADEGVRCGVVFASEDGRVRFENTVEARMEKGRALMIAAIDEMLFGEVF